MDLKTLLGGGGKLQALLGGLIIFALVAGIVFGNTFAIASLGGLGFLLFFASPFRIHILAIALFLEIIVLGQLGYGANSLWGFRAGYIDILLLLTGSSLLMPALAETRRWEIGYPVMLPLLGWLVMLSLTVMAHPQVLEDGLRHLQFLAITPLLVYFIGLTLLDNERKVRSAILSLSVFYLFMAIYYIYVWNTSVSAHGGHVFSALYDLAHSSETNVMFRNKNNTGAMFLVSLPVFVGAMLDEKQPAKKALFGLVSLLQLICLMYTVSRGAFLALLVAPLVTLPLFFRNLVRIVASASVFLVSLAAILWFTGAAQLLQQRFEAGSGLDVDRVEMIRISARALSESPFFGLGLSESTFLDAIYRLTDSSFSWAHPHNSYLQIAVYAGIPALIAFLFMAKRFVGVLLNMRQQTHHVWMNWGLATGPIAFLMVMSTDFQLFRPFSSLAFWVVLTLAVAWAMMLIRQSDMQEA